MPSQNHVLPTHPVPLRTIDAIRPIHSIQSIPLHRRDASALGERWSCPAVVAEGWACCCPPRPPRVTSATHALHRPIHSIHSIRCIHSIHSIHSIPLHRRDASALRERRNHSAVVGRGLDEGLCSPSLSLGFIKPPRHRAAGGPPLKIVPCQWAWARRWQAQERALVAHRSRPAARTRRRPRLLVTCKWWIAWQMATGATCC